MRLASRQTLVAVLSASHTGGGHGDADHSLARPPQTTEQREGVDFTVRDGMLLFERPLAKERVGVGRWTSMVLGIAGSYGKDDSVDVLYRVGGENRVAAKLRFEEQASD